MYTWNSRKRKKRGGEIYKDIMATSLLKLEIGTKHTHTHTQCPTLAVVSPENKWIGKKLEDTQRKKDTLHENNKDKHYSAVLIRNHTIQNTTNCHI